MSYNNKDINKYTTSTATTEIDTIKGFYVDFFYYA